MLLLQRRHGLVPVLRQLAGDGRARTRRASVCRARRFSQARRAPAPARAGGTPALQQIVGHREGRLVPAQRCLAPGASFAPSGEPCTAAVPALVGAPRPMMVRQAISVGFFERTAKDSAAATCGGSCPSTRLGRPAMRGEALQRILRAGERRVAIDRDVRCRRRGRSAFPAADGRQGRSPRG